MQVFLELSGHPKANVQRVILSDTMTVGRSRACGLQIASAAVSRKHCEIRLNGEQASVIDLGSSNGTFVDSERLPAGEERPLPPGCRLNIGGVRFIVRYEPAESERADSASGPDSLSAAIALAATAEADEPLAVEEPLLADEPLSVEESPAADEPLIAEETSAADEPILRDEPLFADEPLLAEEPHVTNGSQAVEKPKAVAAPIDEPDLAELFDEGPSSETEAGAASEEEPILADEEPILEADDEEPILESEQEADEDQALAFLNDDEPATTSRKRGEDSQLGDFLSQFGRD